MTGWKFVAAAAFALGFGFRYVGRYAGHGVPLNVRATESQQEAVASWRHHVTDSLLQYGGRPAAATIPTRDAHYLLLVHAKLRQTPSNWYVADTIKVRRLCISSLVWQ